MKNIRLQIPEELEKFRQVIEKTIRPYVKIELKSQNTLPWESKIGGNPYLEIGMEYPKTLKGEQLRLLAQINFEEVPHIEPFPTKGILQVFIFPDDLYGADFDNPCKQDTFRIIYLPEVKKDEKLLVTDFSFLKELEEEWYLPFEKEGKMYFSKEYMPVQGYTYEFEALYKDIHFTDEDMENYIDELNYSCCRIGGYPEFTQSDPREGNKELSLFDTLLLQLDCESECDLMFGDSGIANFFIKEEDLRNLDFSNVLYNWDCY
ncbi:YwqG family protein [Clostridium brassicae]|uniref:YwqG family protein n=1 Tax=Clostridium brassicae TaxID=2999072 RepID=A0ABT4D6S3_9CLOT|nr:YwqG family protein [Clostridium brassicae]MCY6957992.1 YwqG family protein [Clostridium brassicae]